MVLNELLEKPLCDHVALCTVLLNKINTEKDIADTWTVGLTDCRWQTELRLSMQRTSRISNHNDMGSWDMRCVKV